jgi:hypothetical protein
VIWETGKAPFFGGGAKQRLGLEKLDIAPEPELWKTTQDDGEGVVRLTDGTDAQAIKKHHQRFFKRRATITQRRPRVKSTLCTITQISLRAIYYWGRSVAAEQDVKGLIWLTRIKFND